VGPSSTRRWIGVGAALSGLPAAGGCFCAALLLALVADSDPGAVYEQERWLGVAVATGAACAFAAMLGWATLRHGGLPAPVLLVALVVAAVPFALPGGLFLPAVAAAVAACAALATYGLARPPASPRTLRRLTGGLAAAALTLAVGQAIAVGLHGSGRPASAAVKTSRAPANAVAAKPAAPHTPRTDAHDGSRDAHDPSKEAADRSTDAPAAPVATPDPSPATPAPDPNLREATPPPAAAPAGAERFVRDYYAALDERRFGAAWRMLAPSVQTAFGGFAKWRRGYARTLVSSPGELRVRPAGAGATVGLTLRAEDRDACGKTVARRFAVTWQLARTDAGWRATAAAARALSGAEPAAAC
jgi:hypothetical protein